VLGLVDPDPDPDPDPDFDRADGGFRCETL
jgi:hypothetical protein